MSPQAEESSHSEGPVVIPDPENDDDEPLTVRIPNPKAYMARQSQWVGRRGKPRCDHCRTANLKCDRVLPICNHCSWAGVKECIYTPLPTPAHRGIPRCDRCRTSNEKCDRNLPVCGNCKEADGGNSVSCNYTPKKRNNKQDVGDVSGGGAGGAGGRANPKVKKRRTKGNDIAINSEPPPRTDHTFYGQNVASTSALPKHLSPIHSESELAPEVDSGHTGRFTANFANGKGKEPDEMIQAPVPLHTSETEYLPAPDIIHSPTMPTEPIKTLTHTFVPPNKNMRRVASVAEPWSHPGFAPLPAFALRDLQQIDYREHPTRLEIDTATWALLFSLVDDLRETAVLNTDLYAKTALALRTGKTQGLSERMKCWTIMHHLSSGSDKYSVILVPDDTIFCSDENTLEMHRRQFMDALMDPAVDAKRLQECHYSRLPVENQLYDILSWAHRNHANANGMLKEVNSLGFAFITWTMAEMYARLCPQCNRWRLSAEMPFSDVFSYPATPVLDSPYAVTPTRTPVAVPTWGPYVPTGY